jgi:hypothetical protein
MHEISTLLSSLVHFLTLFYDANLHISKPEPRDMRTPELEYSSRSFEVGSK